MSRAPRVAALADAVLKQVAMLENPYFTALVDGSMSLAHFRATQEQFYFAVRYYARPIAALVSRIADPAQRVDLLHNLVEEHGDFHPEQFHQNTFQKFLVSIQGRSPDLAGVPMCAAVDAFNSILIGACANEPPEVGICCLGIIEQAFAGVSALIGKLVVQRGWVAAKELIHYDLHAQLDVRHAEDLFVIVEPSYEHAQGRMNIERGLQLGAYAFDQLYRGLFVRGETGAA